MNNISSEHTQDIKQYQRARRKYQENLKANLEIYAQWGECLLLLMFVMSSYTHANANSYSIFSVKSCYMFAYNISELYCFAEMKSNLLKGINYITHFQKVSSSSNKYAYKYLA